MTHSPSPLAYMRDHISTMDQWLSEKLPTLRTAHDIITLGHAILRQCEQVDAHLQEIRPTPPLACREGCGTCCHNRIEVNPLWAFVTLDHAQKTLSEEKLRIIEERLDNEAAFCPFHFNGACSIYENRPPVCRGYYSFDLALCLKGHYCEEEKGYQGDDAHAAHQNMIFLFVLEDHLKNAEQSLNLDAGPVFLDDAVAALLKTDDNAPKWLKGDRLFSDNTAP